MVLLTISPTILEALEEVRVSRRSADEEEPRRLEAEAEDRDHESSTAEVKGEAESEKSNDAEISTVMDAQVSQDKESMPEREEPSLSAPKLGDPISHGQVIDLWKEMKARSPSPKTLELLLRGSRVYVPPP